MLERLAIPLRKHVGIGAMLERVDEVWVRGGSSGVECWDGLAPVCCRHSFIFRLHACLQLLFMLL